MIGVIVWYLILDAMNKGAAIEASIGVGGALYFVSALAMFFGWFLLTTAVAAKAFLEYRQHYRGDAS